MFAYFLIFAAAAMPYLNASQNLTERQDCPDDTTLCQAFGSGCCSTGEACCSYDNTTVIGQQLWSSVLACSYWRIIWQVAAHRGTCSLYLFSVSLLIGSVQVRLWISRSKYFNLLASRWQWWGCHLWPRRCVMFELLCLLSWVPYPPFLFFSCTQRWV